MARQLLLIRHASPEAAWAGRFLGSTDVALSEEGERQAKALVEVVKRKKPGKCFCSPMTRARRTGEILFEEAGEIDADLREIDFGQWEGKTFAEISAAEPERVTRWAEFSGDFAFPQGEGIGAFLNRVRSVAARLAGDPAEVVAAVTHGGVIRAMICQLLGLEAKNYVLFGVGYATCVTVDLFEGKGVLSGMEGV